MQSYEVSAISGLSLSKRLLRSPLARLDAAHHADELPEQPAAEADAHQADGRGEDRGGDDERERGDDDLEGEQRLEAEYRPVAPPVHAEGEEQQDEREKDSTGERAAVAAEVVDRGHAEEHREGKERADGDRDEQRGRPLVLAQRLQRDAEQLFAPAALWAVGGGQLSSPE